MDKHLRAVNSLPADLPKIDFSMYKTRVAVPGMVDTFEKSYAGLQIPYPADQVLQNLHDIYLLSLILVVWTHFELKQRCIFNFQLSSTSFLISLNLYSINSVDLNLSPIDMMNNRTWSMTPNT